MDALWWFYTIVLSTAFAAIATAIAVQWKTRIISGDRLHAPILLWQIFLLILTVEVWIAVGFYQRSVTSLSIFSLIAFLWVPMGIFILGVFLADPVWARGADRSDDDHFDRLRRPFFIVLLLIPAVNFAHEAVRGSIAMDADTWFPALIALGAVIGMFLRSRIADTILAAAMCVVIATYLVTSYGTISAV